jgi:glycosyltransferase involved in cell wall biosynthesis
VRTSGEAAGRPRILHFLGTSQIGGTERFLVDLLRRMPDEFESGICVLDAPGALAPDYLEVASRVVHFGGIGWAAAIRRWRALVREWRPHVVVMYGARANLIGRTATPRECCALITALRSVVVDDRGAAVAPALDRVTFRRVSACVSNSRAALHRLIERGYPRERLCYIPPGIDRVRFSTPSREDARLALGIPPGELMLLSVANLKPVKNLAALVGAAAELKRSGVQHRLWLVGDGPARETLEALARASQCADCVVFAGFTRDPRVYYAAADLYLLASRWEGSPTALLEASAYGVPAITTAVGDIPYLVRDGLRARVLRPGTPAQFARAIEAFARAEDSVRSPVPSTASPAASLSSDRSAEGYRDLFRWAAGDRSGPMPCAVGESPPTRRIVRILSRLNVGGPAIHVTLLARDLNDHRHTTDLISGSLAAGEGDMSYLAEEQGVVVHRVRALGRSVNPWNDVLALAQLLRLLRRIRPDVVHTHASKAGTLGRLAAVLYNLVQPRRRRAAVVHTYHGHTFAGYFGPIPSWTFRNIERLLARLTDKIIVLSPSQQTDVVERFRIAPMVKTAVVPLGLDLGPFLAIDTDRRGAAKAALGLPSETRVFLSVGRLTAIKNHRLLLDAFARVAHSHDAVALVIAGDGELREDLRRHSEQVGLGGRVRFAGWVRDTVALYAAADVVVLSSRNEGTPVALIEALAAGCVSVGTRVGGVPDVIDDTCGILVPSDDEGALAAAMARAMTLGPLPAVCRAQARRFSIERLVQDLSSMYERLLATHRALPGQVP